MPIAIAPSGLLSHVVAEMAIGEVGYTRPAALVINAPSRYAIRNDAIVQPHPDAAASMIVMRTATGYIADLTYCSHHWTATDRCDALTYTPLARVVCGDQILD